MRQALNENPVVQVVLLAVLAVAVAFLLVTRVLGGGGSEEPASTEPAPAAGEATGASVQFEGQLSPEEAEETLGAASEALEAGDPEAALGTIIDAAVSADFVAGPGLPKGVVKAYDDGKAVAVLITRKAGIEDKRLRAMIARIESAGNVALFHAYARDIARYSRVTGGVDVSRVPALVVIRPRELSESGIPMASVSYGFRGPASAEQAVRDALYEGRRNLPYHPNSN